MNDDNRADLDLLVQMFGTLERHFPSKDDQLHFLALAWTVLAQQIRTEALAFPGGFTEKQQAQARELENMIQFVSEAKPDVEADRLFQEGDIGGLTRHYHQQRRKREGGQEPDKP